MLKNCTKIVFNWIPISTSLTFANEIRQSLYFCQIIKMFLKYLVSSKVYIINT